MARRLTVEIFRRLPPRLGMWTVRQLSFKPSVGVMVLLLRQSDGLLLTVQQRYRKKPFLPGGVLRANETLIQAAARELAEETGLVGCCLRICGEPGYRPRARWLTIYVCGEVDEATASLAGPRGAEVVRLCWVDPRRPGDVDEGVRAALRIGLGIDPLP